jgi:hypothetical protein
VDPFADRWEEGYRRLVAYVEERGRAPAAAYKTPDGYPLGKWLGHQRWNSSKYSPKSSRATRRDAADRRDRLDKLLSV